MLFWVFKECCAVLCIFIRNIFLSKFQNEYIVCHKRHIEHDVVKICGYWLFTKPSERWSVCMLTEWSHSIHVTIWNMDSFFRVELWTHKPWNVANLAYFVLHHLPYSNLMQNKRNFTQDEVIQFMEQLIWVSEINDNYSKNCPRARKMFHCGSAFKSVLENRIICTKTSYSVEKAIETGVHIVWYKGCLIIKMCHDVWILCKTSCSSSHSNRNFATDTHSFLRGSNGR